MTLKYKKHHKITQLGPISLFSGKTLERDGDFNNEIGSSIKGGGSSCFLVENKSIINRVKEEEFARKMKQYIKKYSYSYSYGATSRTSKTSAPNWKNIHHD
jgi:hypothetical protein